VVTFSWLQGNLYPGFGVLSLKDAHSLQIDESNPSFKLDICDLPPQMDIYMGYIILLGRNYSNISTVCILDCL
jgi:hypothetical protein